MEFKKMVYSLYGLHECHKKVDAFDFSIPKFKSGHCIERLNDLGNLFDYCRATTKDDNFDKNYNCFYDYRNAFFCGGTKKELDRLLRQCQRFLNKELLEIEIAIKKGYVLSSC